MISKKYRYFCSFSCYIDDDFAQEYLKEILESFDDTFYSTTLKNGNFLNFKVYKEDGECRE